MILYFILRYWQNIPKIKLLISAFLVACLDAQIKILNYFYEQQQTCNLPKGFLPLYGENKKLTFYSKLNGKEKLGSTLFIT